MVYELSTDLYRKGVSIKEYNCLQIPSAAAVGCYDYDNFFKFLFLTTVYNNWGKDDCLVDIEPDDIRIEEIAAVLKLLGFRLHSYAPEDKENFLNTVKNSIINGTPVLLLVKYNAMFFNLYYMSELGDKWHFLLIDKWNSHTHTFTVRDNSFLRGIQAEGNDIMFPITLTEDMVWELHEKTDYGNMKEEPVRYLYTVERIEGKALSASKDLFDYMDKEFREKQNHFAIYMSNLNTMKNTIAYNYENACRRYIGHVKALCRFASEWLEIGMEEKEFNLNEYISMRKKKLNSIYKKFVACNNVSEKELKEIAETIIKDDNELMKYLRRLAHDKFKEREEKIEWRHLDIKPYYNNRAIESAMCDDTLANISNTGIYFVINKAAIDEAFMRKGMKNIDMGILNERNMDNISCQRQKIHIEKGSYKQLKLYACSEYGNYKDKIEFYLENEKKGETSINVSDFYMAAVFGEKMFCKGLTFQKINGASIQLNFTSRIFEYTLKMPNCKIDTIVLPNKKNIHIFNAFIK
ncbi:hypothetical protein [[Clostridium] polysaccharolyticum]|uniref:Butirosin biosynthesis protein H, N-terminal n=1 Tax=[Clostridium] polysaccharolyticum TaxID=29364 RepID=A0A1I0BCG2_9FIRM|nr:hypothetical protein [[Clostridium] polysaccharolyticum]SET04633.1 hypothetical protein SAMN04487772_10775 [[Clostridium] polysaccharolyticum]